MRRNNKQLVILYIAYKLAISKLIDEEMQLLRLALKLWLQDPDVIWA
jgi:hypothetical protein